MGKCKPQSASKNVAGGRAARRTACAERLLEWQKLIPQYVSNSRSATTSSSRDSPCI